MYGFMGPCASLARAVFDRQCIDDPVADAVWELPDDVLADSEWLNERWRLYALAAEARACELLTPGEAAVTIMSGLFRHYVHKRMWAAAKRTEADT